LTISPGISLVSVKNSEPELSILHQSSDQFVILYVAVVVFKTGEDLIYFLIT